MATIHHQPVRMATKPAWNLLDTGRAGLSVIRSSVLETWDRTTFWGQENRCDICRSENMWLEPYVYIYICMHIIHIRFFKNHNIQVCIYINIFTNIYRHCLTNCIRLVPFKCIWIGSHTFVRPTKQNRDRRQSLNINVVELCIYKNNSVYIYICIDMYI